MDQTQQKALNALEPYILLSKSATSPRAAADLVKQATSVPNTFMFAELLQAPNIQALEKESADYASYLTLLQIFAWGTWEDYKAQKESLPPLSEVQQTKLRQLTLITLASTPSHLSYAHLLTALSLPDNFALESLVITAIYADLLVAQLNPLAQRIDVSSVAPVRDLTPGSVPKMVEVLEDWDKRCVNVLLELEDHVSEVRRKALERRRREDADGAQRAKLMDEGKGKRGPGEGDVDMGDDGVGKRTRGAKGAAASRFMGGLGKKLGGGG